MIRDPLKRFESFYYFIRFGNKEGDGADVAMSDARKYMTIDECVRAHDRECLEPKWQLVPYRQNLKKSLKYINLYQFSSFHKFVCPFLRP